MATISEELALKLAAKDGKYPGDPQAYAVVKYKGPFGVKHAVCYNQQELLQVSKDVEITHFLFKREPNEYERGYVKGHIDGGIIGMQAAVNLIRLEKKMFGKLSENDSIRNKFIDELVEMIEPWTKVGNVRRDLKGVKPSQDQPVG